MTKRGNRTECFLYAILLTAIIGLAGCGRGAVTPERADSAEGPWQLSETSEENNPTEEECSDGWEMPEEDSNLPIAVSLPGEYIDYIVYSEGRYCYQKDSLYGFLAEDGSEITPCVYSAATPFSEGLACVCLDGKYGYIGKDGETVLPFVYDQASPFREGRAYFSRGEEYGLIHRESYEELRLEGYESISAFREGLAYFCRDGLYGYLDRDGKVVIEPVYDDAGYFYDGLAVVRKNGLCGVIGKDGGEILPCRYMTVDLKDTCIVAEKAEGDYCFDKEGRELLNGAWEYIWEDEGMFLARTEDRCVLANENGEIIYEFAGHSSLDPIQGKDLAVVHSEEGQDGIVDYEGQIVVPFQYEHISGEVNEAGLCYIDGDTGKMGYLDGENLSVKIPAVYDFIGEFIEGRAVVSQNGKHGILKTDGTLELPLAYDGISLFSDGSMAVRTGNIVELRDSQGNRIHIGQYDRIREVGNGYELIKEDGNSREYSYRDRQGRMIVTAYRYGSGSSIPGTENTFLLESSILLITGQESGTSIEKVFLRNQITPEAGPFAEFLKNGTLAVQDATPNGHITELGGWERYEKVFCKLYRIGEEKVLYFHAAPWKQLSFLESHSGLFTVRDGQVTQLLSGYECGGSMRGDYVCFAYDREGDSWKPGVWGSMGGFGGFLTSREVYTLQDGEAAQEVSLCYYNHSKYDYDEEELLENVGLLYDNEDNPYTAETILEVSYNVTEYSVDDKRVTVEEYRAKKERYWEFLPLDLSW